MASKPIKSPSKTSNKTWLGKIFVLLGVLNDILLVPMFASIIMDATQGENRQVLFESSNLWFCASFFSEWMIGLILAPSRMDYLKSFTRITDLVSTIPVGNAFQGLRLMRLTRIIKLVRVVIRAKRYQGPGRNLVRVLAVVGATTFAGAYTILIVESSSEQNFCSPKANAFYALEKKDACPELYDSVGDYCLASQLNSKLFIMHDESKPDNPCPTGFMESGSYCEQRGSSYALTTHLQPEVIGMVNEDCPIDYEKTTDTNIRGFGDALWWSLVTISTVGYGDRYPVSTGGRIIAVGLILIGVGVCGYIAGFMANLMSIGESSEEQVQMIRIETKLDKLAAHLDIDDWDYQHSNENPEPVDI